MHSNNVFITKIFRYNDCTQSYYGIPLSLHEQHMKCQCVDRGEEDLSISEEVILHDQKEEEQDQRRPVVPFSFINPQDNLPQELFDQFFEDNPNWFRHIKFAKTVPPTPLNYISPSSSRLECDIFKIVYNELGSRTGVTGLEFHLIGHGFQEVDSSHDFSSYAKSVQNIHFTGHLSYVTPAFQIMAQLKALKSVVFSIGFDQHPLLLEIYDNYYGDDMQPLEVNPSVESLEVNFNTKVLSTGSIVLKETLVQVLDLIFLRVEECFPNLKSLKLEIPACIVAVSVFKKVLFNARFQKHFKMRAYMLSSEIGVMKLDCLLEGRPEGIEHPILAPINTEMKPWPENMEPGSVDHCLRGYFNRIRDISELMEQFRSNKTARRLMATTNFPCFVIDPPPEFEVWFTEIPLFRVHRYYTGNAEDVDDDEPDEAPTPISYLNDIRRMLDVKEEHIDVIVQRIHNLLPMTWMDKVGEYLGLGRSRC